MNRFSCIALTLLLFLFPFVSYSQVTAPEEPSIDEPKAYDMTGLTLSFGCFDYFSCGAGINFGTYTVGSGHFFAKVFGVLLEYKTLVEMRVRAYGRMYGGSGGMLLGVSSVLSTDFTTVTAGISPEIGIGVGGISVMYRYNLYLESRFNCHEIVLAIYMLET